MVAYLPHKSRPLLNVSHKLRPADARMETVCRHSCSLQSAGQRASEEDISQFTVTIGSIWIVIFLVVKIIKVEASRELVATRGHVDDTS